MLVHRELLNVVLVLELHTTLAVQLIRILCQLTTVVTEQHLLHLLTVDHDMDKHMFIHGHVPTSLDVRQQTPFVETEQYNNDHESIAMTETVLIETAVHLVVSLK